jgi:hypothetical protein
MSYNKPNQTLRTNQPRSNLPPPPPPPPLQRPSTSSHTQPPFPPPSSPHTTTTAIISVRHGDKQKEMNKQNKLQCNGLQCMSKEPHSVILGIISTICLQAHTGIHSIIIHTHTSITMQHAIRLTPRLSPPPCSVRTHPLVFPSALTPLLPATSLPSCSDLPAAHTHLRAPKISDAIPIHNPNPFLLILPITMDPTMPPVFRNLFSVIAFCLASFV